MGIQERAVTFFWLTPSIQTVCKAAPLEMWNSQFTCLSLKNSQPSLEVSLDVQIPCFLGVIWARKFHREQLMALIVCFWIHLKRWQSAGIQWTTTWDDSRQKGSEIEFWTQIKHRQSELQMHYPSCNGTPILYTFYWLGRIIESNSLGSFLYELFEIWSMMPRMSVLPDCHLDSELHEFSLYVIYIEEFPYCAGPTVCLLCLVCLYPWSMPDVLQETTCQQCTVIFPDRWKRLPASPDREQSTFITWHMDVWHRD